MPANRINNPIGTIFTEIDSIDSTNNYAMQMVHKGLSKHGTVFFAHHQFAGKGQRGRSWQSNPGENVVISVLLNTNNLPVSRQFGLSAAIALGVYDFFLFHARNNVHIKWPNDLLWCDRKAGGILIENIIHGQKWQWAVVGIGININQLVFDKAVTNPVSLKQITGESYSALQLAKELCFDLDKRYNQFLHDEIDALMLLYNDVLYKKNEIVRLRKNNVVFNCKIKEVTMFGQLVVEHSIEERFNVGEIEWLIN